MRAQRDDLAFERKLYVIRQLAEHAVHKSGLPGRDAFYIPSLSYKTIVYKGMLTSQQLEEFYPDLADPAMDTALAMIHSRFSTNTFPSWLRSQPFRYMLHNGEINTIRGNLNWMNARQKMLASELFGDDLPKLLPIIDPDGSDSAMFDNVLELLVLGGRSLAHAVMMMIPEPWEHDAEMSDTRRAFYEYHSCLMEPWDGPASVIFSDGVTIGAMLDRNGLRPSRYVADEGQPGRSGLRGRRARHPGRGCGVQGPVAAGQDAAGGHRGAPPDHRRRDQGGGRRQPAVSPVAGCADGGAGRPARAGCAARQPEQERASYSSASRRSATPSRT